MLLLGVGEDDDVVEVDESICEVLLAETVLHETLKCRRGVAQPERHS